MIGEELLEAQLEINGATDNLSLTHLYCFSVKLDRGLYRDFLQKFD